MWTRELQLSVEWTHNTSALHATYVLDWLDKIRGTSHEEQHHFCIGYVGERYRVEREADRQRVSEDVEPWFDAGVFDDCCPKCGGETYTAKYGPECSAGCDTSILTCSECGWQGDPE